METGVIYLLPVFKQEIVVAYFDYNGKVVSTVAGVLSTVSATAAGQTLTATGSLPQLRDTKGGDTLIGGTGSTNFSVADAATVVVQGAHTGVSTVSAWVNFTLPTGVDDLYQYQNEATANGNSAQNLIVAGGAHDIVNGGGGNDVLVDAGQGGDHFQFAAGSGHDVIYGFQTSGANQDFIDLNAYGFTSFSQVAPLLSQYGADTLLTLSATDSVLIRDTQVSSLTASDFLLAHSTSGMTLTFDDEFNSLSLYNGATGAGTWKTSFGFGTQTGSGSWTSRTLAPNGEQEIYVDPTYAGTGSGTTALGLNPFSISNGVLTITAAQTPTADLSSLNGYKYTSGLLTTQNSFAQTYGYFEMKAELPTGQGVWPAFWLVPENSTGTTNELDVMENIGGSTVYTTAHYDTLAGAAQTQWANVVSGLSTGFHTYGLLWTAQDLVWYIDGKAVAEMATPSGMNQPMYMLVNLAIGGTWAGSAPANFTSAQLEIDYIRAYSLTGAATTAATAQAVAAPVTTYTATSATDLPTNTAIDTISSAYSYTLPGSFVHNLVLTGTAALTAKGNSLGDHITGNGGNDTLIGGVGADVLDASLGGNVVLNGGNGGVDTLIGGAGNDTFIVSNASDVVTAVAGHQNELDTSVSFHTPDNIQLVYITGSANVTVWANDTGDKILTNTGNDTVYGGAGNDTFATGVTGVETLVAGKGTDTFWIENAADVILNVPVGSKDLVQSTVSYHLPDNARTLMLEGSANIDGWAGKTDATVVGNSGANHLYAGAGVDILTGGAGNDTFVFGLGSGKATVTDFGQSGDHDVIDISAYLHAGYTASVVNVGANAVISVSNGETITLLGVQASSLTHTTVGYMH